jgi:hypothetical protein
MAGQFRPRSVAARAEQRNFVSSCLLVALGVMPAVVAFFLLLPRPTGYASESQTAELVAESAAWIGRVAVGIASLGAVAVLGVLFTVDVVALTSALHATSRMKRGLAALRPGVDYGVGPDVWVRSIRPDAPYRAQERLEPEALGSPADAAKLIAQNLLWRMGGVVALLLWDVSLLCVALVGGIGGFG